jgi:hypothetical protein
MFKILVTYGVNAIHVMYKDNSAVVITPETDEFNIDTVSSLRTLLHHFYSSCLVMHFAP